MPEFFSIVADTIDGAIQEFPKKIEMVCGKAHGEGVQIIRDYDANFCIVNKRVFLVRYGKHLFGTTQFVSRVEFEQFMNDQCCHHCVHEHTLVYDDCILSYNGCTLKYRC